MFELCSSLGVVRIKVTTAGTFGNSFIRGNIRNTMAGLVTAWIDDCGRQIERYARRGRCCDPSGIREGVGRWQEQNLGSVLVTEFLMQNRIKEFGSLLVACQREVFQAPHGVIHRRFKMIDRESSKDLVLA